MGLLEKIWKIKVSIVKTTRVPRNLDFKWSLCVCVLLLSRV